MVEITPGARIQIRQPGLVVPLGVVKGDKGGNGAPGGSDASFAGWINDTTPSATRAAITSLPIPAANLTGTVPNSVLPPLAISETFPVASQAAMLALTAQRGDVAIRTDLNKSFILSTDSPSTLADWKELLTPTDAVTSVAGKVGVVSLVKADITDLGTIGTAAAKNTGTASGDVPLLSTGGVLPIARLATGTPDGTKFVRDDGTLATPSGGSGAGALLAKVTRTASANAGYTITATASADVDATNLAITLTPTTTAAKIYFEGFVVGPGAFHGMLSLRNGSTNVVGTGRDVVSGTSTGARNRVSFDLTGLTIGTPVTYKLAARVTGGSMNLNYGGTSTDEFANTTPFYGPIYLEAYSA